MEDALAAASRFMQRAGAVLLDLRNTRWPDPLGKGGKDRMSLVVYDWLGQVPVSLMIIGGQVLDDGVPIPEGESIGPVPMVHYRTATD